MKKQKILVLIASQLISISLYSQIQFNETDSVINFLEGEWLWTGSCGGITGRDCSYPENKTSRSYVFNKLEDEPDSIGYTFYLSETEVKSGIANISYSDSLYGDYWFLKGIYGFLSTDVTIFFVHSDTILLSENCFDCYMHEFVRNTELSSLNLSLMKKELMVYPNPCKASLYLKTDNESQIKSVLIVNLNGQIVEQKRGNMSEISISHLPKGQYFIKIITLNETMTRKIIIE